MTSTYTSEGLSKSLDTLAYQEQVFLQAESEWIDRARAGSKPLPGANWFSQILPLTFDAAMVMTGRGWGKTDVASNWSRRQAYLMPGSIGHVVAPTFSDLRFTVFEGISGLLHAIPDALIDDYNKSDYFIRLKNGTFIRGFSAEKPDRLRGPQCHWIWGDEVAAWQRLDETMSNIEFSTRLVYLRKNAKGEVLERIQPSMVFTTTPRPLEQIRSLAENSKYVQVRGALYENRANLAEKFIENVSKHEGTKLGEQEIHGILLNFDESAIIKKRWIRMWPKGRQLPQFEFIYISFDTALTEETYDDKTHETDYTACTVWGVFQFDKRMNVMMLGAWRERMGMPELIEAALKEMRIEYGHTEPEPFKVYAGRAPQIIRGVVKPKLMIIEDIGSGKSLRQSLAREKVPMYPYNPGKASKLERLNAVAYIVKGGKEDGHGRVWVQESVDSTPEKPLFASWADQWFGEVCIYTGPKSTVHDDYVDSTSQALRYFGDNFLSGSVNDKMEKSKPKIAQRRENPYG